MRVNDIMTRAVNSLLPDMNAKEALELLKKFRISGLPVIDKDKKLVGMFTEKEIITKILPGYLESVGKFIYEENPKAVKDKIIHFSNFKVSDVMRKDVVTITEDTALCEAAHVMLTQKIRRLPVLNKQTEIVGIVSRGDVLKALFEEYKNL